MSEVVVKIRELEKAYGGVRALHDVSMDIVGGEVHALCGENGAGKSTLIKCLTGVVTPDRGRVEVGGQPLRLGSVAAAEEAGIAVIHQESVCFPDLNTLDNLFVGREPRRAGGWLLDKKRMWREAAELLERLGQRFDLERPIRELSTAQRQMVEMARALSRKCRLLIMDEPTASLSARETRVLLDIVRRLRDDGVSILYVSHRLEEIFELATQVTVLRDGELVDTREIKSLDKDELIRLMVGRDVGESIVSTNKPANQEDNSAPRLEIRGLTSEGTFNDIDLTVRAGEVVGLAGLVGAGRSELARAVFGIDRYSIGSVMLNGQPLRPANPRAAIRQGLALVPEDRQHEGLIPPMTVGSNLSLAILKQLTRARLIHRRGERELAHRMIERLAVKTAGSHVAAETLSGGNQQKLVLGKWLATEPNVLILDEPTRGIDVGAKAQIHQLIRQLADAGMATLMISSELPEVLAVSDRVVVMREGRISGRMDRRNATQERILELALPDREALLETQTQ